jgi:hypothetical protein
LLNIILKIVINFYLDNDSIHNSQSGRPKLKLLDASYEPEPGEPDHIRFYTEYYGNWTKLLRDKVEKM